MSGLFIPPPNTDPTPPLPSYIALQNISNVICSTNFKISIDHVALAIVYHLSLMIDDGRPSISFTRSNAY